MYMYNFSWMSSSPSRIRGILWIQRKWQIYKQYDFNTITNTTTPRHAARRSEHASWPRTSFRTFYVFRCPRFQTKARSSWWSPSFCRCRNGLEEFLRGQVEVGYLWSDAFFEDVLTLLQPADALPYCSRNRATLRDVKDFCGLGKLTKAQATDRPRGFPVEPFAYVTISTILGNQVKRFVYGLFW